MENILENIGGKIYDTLWQKNSRDTKNKVTETLFYDIDEKNFSTIWSNDVLQSIKDNYE